jgi:hypothetical protein
VTLIESLAQYIEFIGAQIASWRAHDGDGILEPVFRGQVDASWELIPGLLRGVPYLKQTEDRLLSEFQRGALPFLQRPPHGRLQWMALAQHHGLPTRLLDWSESALVALFFALQEPEYVYGLRPVYAEHACVWVLNRNALHARFRLPSHIILLDAAERAWPETLHALVEGAGDGVLVFTPAHISARMPVQKAAFTLFGQRADALEVLRGDPLMLRQLVVPRARVPALRRELEVAGITRATLFPDLDGVACEVWDRELRRRRELHLTAPVSQAPRYVCG